MKEIYYNTDIEENEPNMLAASINEADPAAATATSINALTTTLPLLRERHAVKIPDSSIPAIDIVRSLIAQKLKKPLLDIPVSKAIRDLVGGESSNFLRIQVASNTDTGTFQVNPRSKMKLLAI
jgi:fatty acid synthase subunit alpha